MGKAQSKRSVDITTEVKKGAEEEVTEKLEKIEDVDQKQQNGDATPQELNEPEKKEGGEAEVDKDLTTEKSAESSVENGEQNTTTTSEVAKDDPSKESGAGTEDISPLADESIKKSKKEKVKKKWSFRSISFGKKDKQKPAKSEETAEAAPVTNGDAEKANGENADSSKVEKTVEDAAVAAIAAKPAESNIENGNATEKELNGQKTPTSTPIDEKPTEPIVNDTTTTATASASAPATASNETAIENNQTEVKASIAMNISVESAPKPDSEKNGIESLTTAIDVQMAAVTLADNAVDKIAAAINEVAAVVESNKTIPSGLTDGHEGGENPYQNGTNGVIETEPEAVSDQIKTQMEVKNDTDNTTITSDTHTIITNTTTTNCTNNTNSPEPLTYVSTPNATITINTATEQSNSDQIEDEEQNEKEQKQEPEPQPQSESLKNEEATTVANISESPIQVPSAISTDNVNNDNDKNYLVDEECRASNVVPCEPEIDSQLQEPPPLPVSPPPSQVSVFAFNNDNTENVQQEIIIPPITTINLKTSTSQSNIEAVNEKQSGDVANSEADKNDSTSPRPADQPEAEINAAEIVTIENELKFDPSQLIEGEVSPLPEHFDADVDMIEVGDNSSHKDKLLEIEDVDDEAVLSPMGSILMEAVDKLGKVSEILTDLLEDAEDEDKVQIEGASVTLGENELVNKKVDILIEDSNVECANDESQCVADVPVAENVVESSTGKQSESEQNGNIVELNVDNKNNEVKTSEIEMIEDHIEVIRTFNDNSNTNLLNESEIEMKTENAVNANDNDDKNDNENKNEKEKEMKMKTNYDNDNDISEDCTTSMIKNQIENLTLNADEDDGGESFNSSATKNIVNAKDLKENAAAEIITQEISVTNE